MFALEEPIGVDLKCAPGQVWIQEFDATSNPLGFGPFWRTVALDGRAVTFSRVLFPKGFNPHRISESRAIGVVVDSVGLERLATLSLPRFSRQDPAPLDPLTSPALPTPEEN